LALASARRSRRGAGPAQPIEEGTMPATLCRPILSLFAALLATVIVAPGTSAADYVLRFASLNTADAPRQRDIFEPLARQIEKASGGRIQIDLRPMGGFGKPADHFARLERGDIEIAIYCAGR
jgi:TRAP-type transport system periplasmic protein